MATLTQLKKLTLTADGRDRASNVVQFAARVGAYVALKQVTGARHCDCKQAGCLPPQLGEGEASKRLEKLDSATVHAWKLGPVFLLSEGQKPIAVSYACLNCPTRT